MKTEKPYDTKKSTCLVQYSNGYRETDVKRYTEILYVAENGKFFLHKIGGALSCMAKPTGSVVMTKSEEIVPLTNDQAVAWVNKQEELSEHEEYMLRKHGFKEE